MENETTHIERICRQHAITIDWRPRTDGRAWRTTRRIRIRHIKTCAHYFIALHELGHVLGPQPRTRLEREYAAWQWALDNAIRQPDEAAWLEIHAALRSYVSWARSRQYRKNVKPVIPPSDHPLWALLARAHANF